MKNIFRIIIITGLSYFINSVNTHACTCLPNHPTDFCSSLNSFNYVAMVEVNSFNGNFMSVSVVENFGSQTLNSNITIIGHNGSNCNKSIDEFNIGDNLVVGLFFNKTDTFDLSVCGVYFLRLSQNQISGHIKPGITVMDYNDFKSDIENCVVLSNKEVEEESNSIYIFPNPANSFISISSLNKSSEYEISILSTTNQLISAFYTKFSESREVNIDNLLSGIYILKIRSAGSIITKKFIKI